MSLAPLPETLDDQARRRRPAWPAGLLITTPRRQTPAHAHALMLTPLALAGYTAQSVRAAQVSRAAVKQHDPPRRDSTNVRSLRR
jgi:hypothetical protein